MIKTLFKVSVFIFITGCHQYSGPVLKIDTTLLEKINDTALRSSFIIKNEGDRTLIIEDFSASCECTVLEMKKGREILPGKSMVVPLTFERDSTISKQLVVVTLKTNTVPKLKVIKIVI